MNVDKFRHCCIRGELGPVDNSKFQKDVAMCPHRVLEDRTGFIEDKLYGCAHPEANPNQLNGYDFCPPVQKSRQAE